MVVEWTAFKKSERGYPAHAFFGDHKALIQWCRRFDTNIMAALVFEDESVTVQNYDGEGVFLISMGNYIIFDGDQLGDERFVVLSGEEFSQNYYSAYLED